MCNVMWLLRLLTIYRLAHLSASDTHTGGCVSKAAKNSRARDRRGEQFPTFRGLSATRDRVCDVTARREFKQLVVIPSKVSKRVDVESINDRNNCQLN